MAGKNQQHEVTLKMLIEGLGKFVQDQNKASGSLDKTRKSAQSADRSLKGAAQASSNSTKNFSKMAQGITGGLVPAYATLAANLFALDAAFRFLKGAADFRVLTQGQQAFSASTGIAYKSLAKDIQEATRGMVTFSEASQAGAIGRAAGLSSGQLRELSEAAFTVSVALGRDVTDSFNRLVRGVTKAEPELLDELGIILRLEEASTKYAAALGLNKNQLSIYQKSQAVVNEVLGQAEEKFGKINAIMDPTANALSQVGIAFDELLNKFRPMIAGIAEPMAKFIASNTTNAAIAMGLFASSILKSLIPSTNELRIRQADAAKARLAEIEVLKQKEEELAAKVKQLSSPSLAQNKFARKLGADRLGAGGKLGNQIADGEKLSKAQISNLHSQHSREIGMFKNMSDNKRAYYKKILVQMTKEHDTFITKNVARSQQGAAQIQLFFSRSAANIKAVFNTVSVAASKVGMFFSGALGWVAILSMLYMGFKAIQQYLSKDSIKTQEKFNESVDKGVQSLSTLNEELLAMTQVRDRGLIGSGEETMLHTFEAIQSVDFAKVTKELMVLGGISDINQEKFNELTDSFDETLKHLGKLNPEFIVLRKELAEAGKMTPELQAKFFALRDKVSSVGSALKALTNNSAEMVKQQNRLTQALPKVPYQDMLALMQSNVEQYKELNKAGENYQSQLVAETNKIKIYTYFQKQSVDLQKQMASNKFSQAFDGLAGGTTRDKQLKVEEKRLNVANETHKLDMINLQMFTESDEKKLAALKQQQAVQLKMVESAQGMYLLEEKKANLMFETYNTVYKNLEADLGKAIGAGMRGDSTQFENIGKNFTNVITDAIGGMLSEQLMEDTIGSLFPNAKTIEEEIKDGAAKHAQLIQEAIEKGGFSHKNSINAATDQFTSDMYNIQKAILQANQETEEKRKKRLSTDLTALQTEMKTAEKLTTLRGTKDFMDTEGYKDYKTKQIMNTMLSSREIEAVKEAQALLDESNTEAGKKKLTSELYQNKDDLLGGGAYTQAVKDAGATIARILTPKSEQFDTNLLTNVTPRAEQFKSMKDQEKSFMAAIQGSNDIIAGLEKKRTSIDSVVNPTPKAKETTEFTLPPLSTEGIIYFDPVTGKTVVSTPNLAGKIAQSLGTGFDPLNPDMNNISNADGSKTEEKEEMTMDKFSKNLNQFSGVIGMMGALTGNEEKTAKIMAKVAQIQLMIVAYERAKMAIDQGGGKLLGTIGKFFTGTVPTGRDGGVMSKGYRSFAGGGVSDGPNSGYGAILHGKEAVVPLPNNRSIPVELSGKSNGPVNTSITVNMAEGSSTTTSDEETGKQFAQAINIAVLEEITKQQRPGGLLAG
jgi:hypothetical protein